MMTFYASSVMSYHITYTHLGLPTVEEMAEGVLLRHHSHTFKIGNEPFLFEMCILSLFNAISEVVGSEVERLYMYR